jgi:low affinity Fe/Cu permease
MKHFFHRISIKIAHLAGTPYAFIAASIGVIIWLIVGPYYHFSNTWMIAISTISDVIIFLMVFSIQNTQNRDSKAIQLKLNELIAVDKKARDSFIGLESLTDEELSDLDGEFQKLLDELDVKSPLHRMIHGSIKREKAKRPSFYQQAENIVDHIIKSVEDS